MRDPRAEAERWLGAAGEDLAYARHAASGGYHAPACFFAQQTAENAVKAVHYGRGARAVLGHNVRALVEALEPRELRLDALLDAARELDLLYLPTRYPNGLDAGTPAQAFSGAHSKRALELAERLLRAAQDAWVDSSQAAPGRLGFHPSGVGASSPSRAHLRTALPD